MRYFLLTLITLASLNAKASTQSRYDASTRNLVNALSHCLPEFQAAMEGASFVGNIEFGSPRPSNPRIQSNSIH